VNKVNHELVKLLSKLNKIEQTLWQGWNLGSFNSLKQNVVALDALFDELQGCSIATGA